MADFRRFYNPGLEHHLYLEDLERSALRINVRPTETWPAMQALRRWLAHGLTALAERIDPRDRAPVSNPVEVA